MTSIEILSLESKVIKMRENKEHLNEFLQIFDTTRNIEWLSKTMQKNMLKFLTKKGY
jgi:hypothetical protein